MHGNADGLLMTTESITFWYGCNVVRHGDVVRASIALLEAVGIEVQPAGGPAYCCGTTKDANVRAAEGMAVRTVEKFNAIGKNVVTWCPSCHRHMDSFIGAYTTPQFEVLHITEVLHRHRDRLAAKLIHPIPRRVALHTHMGFREVDVNGLVIDLLRLIPGLEIAEVEDAAPAHMCSALAALPDVMAKVTHSHVEMAKRAGAQDLVTIFHSCQRLLCGLAATQPFGVVNYVSLLARAMGMALKDEYTAWKIAPCENDAVAMIGPERIKRAGAEFFNKQVLPEIRRKPRIR